MPNSTPPTLEALVRFVADFVSRHYEMTSRTTPGASLATAIRQSFGDFKYEQLGLTKLADVVAQAEARGLVVRNRQVTHMELLPSPSARPATTPAGSGESEANRRYVRPNVWRALMFFRQEQSHFLDRETGELVSVPSGEASELEKYSGNSRYAMLAPVPSDTQRAWAKDFLKTQGLGELLLETTDGRWWIPFYQRIKQDTQTSNAWNRYRAEKVGAYLTEWASQNTVNSQSLFVPARPERRAFVAQAVGVEGDEEIRRAIVESVQEMTLDELKAIAVPVRCILRHFRTR